MNGALDDDDPIADYGYGRRVKRETFEDRIKTNKRELEMALSVRANLFLSNDIMDVVDSEFVTLWNGSFSEQVKKNGHRYQSTSEPGNFEPPIIQWVVDLMNVGMVQAQPKVCDGNLIAVTSGGIIAIDFKTGKKLWSKELANVWGVAKRGVTCAIIDTDKERRIFVPTGSGILCLKAKTGKVDRAICDKGRLGQLISMIPPEVDGRRVFVATMRPSGVEAYDIATGQRLWRTEFEEGSSLLAGGSNPWSGFIMDRERGLLFVNTGSPSNWKRFIFGPDKYKYSNSLLAVDIHNGNIRWQFSGQSVDFWDHDFVGRPILIDDLEGKHDAVITLSKGGSVFVIDRDTGKSIFPLKEKTYEFGNFTYVVRSSKKPEPLLGFMEKIFRCSNCGLNTKIMGMTPPIMKMKRVFDGWSGGPQWPGASYDDSSRLLVIPSNRNLLFEDYYDFAVTNDQSFPDSDLLGQCFQCHDDQGKVGIKGEHFVPSLLFVSKLHNKTSLLKYFNKNKVHKKLMIEPGEAGQFIEIFRQYDAQVLESGNFEIFTSHTPLNPLGSDSGKLAPFGLISAISVDNGELVWQVPAGEFIQEGGGRLLGSPNIGGIAVGLNGDPYSYFTGSYDNKIYAIDNFTGHVVWEHRLEASGSAPPQIRNEGDEQWIFVVATGGRIAGNHGTKLYGFKRVIKVEQGP